MIPYMIVHTYMHDIEFNPYNLNQRFDANDGGVWLSTDTLATVWTPRSDGAHPSELDSLQPTIQTEVQ